MKRYAGFIALGLLSLAAIWLVREEPAATVKQGTAPSVAEPQISKASTVPTGSGFDFYVLSLSWSPAFCAGPDAANNHQQCGASRKYGFIVHGLWPQNEKGYPEFCTSAEPERVPDILGRGMFDIMPSMGLIGHQWRKHGSCSGLSQKDYLAVTRAAYNNVTLPDTIAAGKGRKSLSSDAVESAFVDANPGMSKQGIAISCDRQKLEEVRICLNKDLSFRLCPEVDRQGCRSNATEIIPIQ